MGSLVVKSDNVIQWVIEKVLGPLMDKIPLRHKTLLGCIAIGIAGVLHYFAGDSPLDTPEKWDDWCKTGAEILVWAGPILFGIGVFHKAAKMQPPK
jgi:hypothetical protein